MLRLQKVRGTVPHGGLCGAERFDCLGQNALHGVYGVCQSLSDRGAQRLRQRIYSCRVSIGGGTRQHFLPRPRRRHGGGGEPLLQADFVSQFLKACKEEYAINTAIETSSYATWEKASSVFDYVDIFQMDIKHMDSAEHMRLTGVPNAPILANIQRVAQTYDFSKRTMIIRVPVIPGLNSSEENIAATAEFVRRLEVVKRVELLPYHSYGAAKYERTKWSGSYQLNALAPTAPDELMERLAALVRSFGLTVKIGG